MPPCHQHQWAEAHWLLQGQEASACPHLHTHRADQNLALTSKAWWHFHVCSTMNFLSSSQDAAKSGQKQTRNSCFVAPCQLSRICNLIQACQAANKLPLRGVTKCILLVTDCATHEAPHALSWLCCLVASVPVNLLLANVFSQLQREGIAYERKTESTAPPAGLAACSASHFC